MQAITSPQEPATMWPVGVSPLRSGPGGQLNARENRKKARRFRARMAGTAHREPMTFFTPSYVLKKNIEPGAEPMAPAPRPAYTPLAETEGERQCEAVRDRVYTPLKPPDLMKPSADCSRVLIVSSGYSAMSTEGPATAPDSSEHTKEGWRPVALMAAALSLYVRVSLAGVLHARALCLSVSLSLSSSPAETTSTRVPVRLSPASPHQAYTHTISPSFSVSLSLSLSLFVCVCVCVDGSTQSPTTAEQRGREWLRALHRRASLRRVRRPRC